MFNYFKRQCQSIRACISPVNSAAFPRSNGNFRAFLSLSLSPSLSHVSMPMHPRIHHRFSLFDTKPIVQLEGSHCPSFPKPRSSRESIENLTHLVIDAAVSGFASIFQSKHFPRNSFVPHPKFKHLTLSSWHQIRFNRRISSTASTLSLLLFYGNHAESKKDFFFF